MRVGRGQTVGLLVAAVLAVMPAVASAGSGVFKWVDKQGVTHYSNVRTDAAPQTAASINVAPASAPTNRASIFKYRDASGVLHYTDRKPRTSNYVVLSIYCPACDPHSRVDWDHTKLNLTAYQSEINNAATTWGVDAAFVRALIHAESAFNPDAQSRKGAQGLMQLMPATAGMYGVTNAFDATENINAGVQHLAALIKDFNGNLDLAAAAYNAGAGAVRKYNGVPPYEETKVYVQRVGVLHKRYQAGI
ncbi:MAG TPA: transglycosylase SLT domain-containing protein [Xanthomonadales bacterium]|nr:transglycosylase SLT domain-containing protein [Xanthomonadales bacterium]